MESVIFLASLVVKKYSLFAFFNSCRLLAGRIFVRQCRMDQQITQACVTSVSYNYQSIRHCQGRRVPYLFLLPLSSCSLLPREEPAQCQPGSNQFGYFAKKRWRVLRCSPNALNGSIFIIFLLIISISSCSFFQEITSYVGLILPPHQNFQLAV